MNVFSRANNVSVGTRTGEEISNGVGNTSDDGVPVVKGEPGVEACPSDGGRRTTGVGKGVSATSKLKGKFTEMSGTIEKKPTAPIRPAIKQQMQIHKKTVITIIQAIQLFLDISHPI
jgi:hypothetical protein